MNSPSINSPSPTNSRSTANSRSAVNRQLGFTLLEILVALTILALVALTLGNQTGQSLIQAESLSLKTQSLWLVEDRLAALDREPWPDVGIKTIDMPDNDLQIITDIATTNDEDFRRVTVSVVQKSTADQSREIISMTAFKGRY
jgi:general secretion pathway protein I